MKDECENCFKSFADNADCVPVCKCGNVIHKSCIDKWLSLQDSTCSDCKQRLDLKEIVDRLLFSEDDGEKDLEKCELREEKQTKEILSRSRQLLDKVEKDRYEEKYGKHGSQLQLNQNENKENILDLQTQLAKSNTCVQYLSSQLKNATLGNKCYRVLLRDAEHKLIPYTTRSCIARTQSLLDKIGFNKLECDDLKQKLDERKAEIEKLLDQGKSREESTSRLLEAKVSELAECQKQLKEAHLEIEIRQRIAGLTDQDWQLQLDKKDEALKQTLDKMAQIKAEAASHLKTAESSKAELVKYRLETEASQKVANSRNDRMQRLNKERDERVDQFLTKITEIGIQD